MSEREINLLLEDMITSIQHVLDFTNGYTFEQYEADNKTKFAVERNFEIIGEAASRIPEVFKTINPEVEWRVIKDFRNFIIHDYFGINNEIVWDTIQLRLPELLNMLRSLHQKYNQQHE